MGTHCYECVQLIEYPCELTEFSDDKYGIAHAFINLNDYTEDELTGILRAYYSGTEMYCLDTRIKVECVFETFALNNIVQNACSREEAEKIIQDILWQNILIKNDENENDPYVFLPINIEINQSIIKLLKMFDELYGNTNQDLYEWAVEFQLITRMLIHHKALLVNPIHLEVDEETLMQILMKIPYSNDRTIYMKARKYIGL